MSWGKPILKQGKVGKVLFISLLSFLFRPKSNDICCLFLFRFNHWLFGAISSCGSKSSWNVRPRVHTRRRWRRRHHILRGISILRLHQKRQWETANIHKKRVMIYSSTEIKAKAKSVFCLFFNKTFQYDEMQFDYFCFSFSKCWLP